MKTRNNPHWTAAVTVTLTAFAPVVGAIVMPALVSTPAYAQEDVKVYLTDGKPKLGPNGKPVPQPTKPKTAQELIAASNITTMFTSRNGQYNVFAIITYKSAQPQYFTTQLKDASGKIVDGGNAKTQPEMKMAAGFFIVNDTGTYTLAIYGSDTREKPVATIKFTVTAPKPN